MQPRNTYNHTYITFFSWTKQNNLTLNPDKTTYALFTPDPAEYKSNLDLKINNIALLIATHPKVLGLTLDPKLKYSTHIHNILIQAHIQLQMINARTATGWGKQKETVMATYKAVMRPALEYASSIWSFLHPRPALTNCKSCRMQHSMEQHRTPSVYVKHSYLPELDNRQLLLVLCEATNAIVHEYVKGAQLINWI